MLGVIDASDDGWLVLRWRIGDAVAYHVVVPAPSLTRLSRSDRQFGNVVPAKLPTDTCVHSVAADGTTGPVFVPIAANDTRGQCHAGCIAVFAARR